MFGRGGLNYVFVGAGKKSKVAQVKWRDSIPLI